MQEKCSPKKQVDRNKKLDKPIRPNTGRTKEYVILLGEPDNLESELEGRPRKIRHTLKKLERFQKPTIEEFLRHDIVSDPKYAKDP